MKDELLKYMIQDIRLLGGIMLKAQEIYISNYSVDIVSKLTVSSLALTIFRTQYYDVESFPIHIPSMNEDTFIRRGYYGGHADAYIPHGENLYYYDVNSLYPFIMKEYPMPGGKPVWHGKLEDHDLDQLCGFIEAYIECPSNMKRPFLPYRESKNKSLIFPTGKFVGVYYSEEFKFAKKLGYKIIPIKGYLFKTIDSNPFKNYVSNLFEKRQEAKRNDNDAMSYIYKILMNSLYGRFGINQECEVTVICDYDKYNKYIKDNQFKYGTKLSEYHYLVTYRPNRELDSTEWKAPKLSAVQLSAAITACARIYMYPFISRNDCYYTDTDSVVLGSPLPSEYLSETDLGKFKCEYLIKKGIFLAAKSYNIQTNDGKNITKQKGISKSLVDKEWFEEQYDDIERIKEGHVTSVFSIDWDKWEIG
jgi:DNA polymerase elongation subunit (family B)